MVPMKTNEHDGGAAFEALVGKLNYPMFIVTTTSGGRQGGCLVGFASQVSIQPRRFLVGLSNKNHTYRLAEQAEHLAVHVLAARERDLARLFGESRPGTSPTSSRSARGTPDRPTCPFSTTQRPGSAAASWNGCRWVTTSRSCWNLKRAEPLPTRVR